MKNQTLSRLRIAILVAYLLFSMLSGWISNVSGHGYPQPAYVLGSWAWLAVAGGARLLPFLGKGDWLPVIVGLLEFAIYLFGMMMLSNVLRREFRFPIPIIQILVHLIGVLLCVFALGVYWPERLGGGVDRTPWVWIVPAGIAAAYFLLEWRMALRSDKGTAGPGFASSASRGHDLR